MILGYFSLCQFDFTFLASWHHHSLFTQKLRTAVVSLKNSLLPISTRFTVEVHLMRRHTRFQIQDWATAARPRFCDLWKSGRTGKMAENPKSKLTKHSLKADGKPCTHFAKENTYIITGSIRNSFIQGAPARLRLSFADGKLGVPPLLPSCYAHSARFPPAQAQLGRLSNIPEID